MRHEFVRPRLAFGDNILNATGRELVRPAHTLPGQNRIRRAPPQVAHWRRGKRNSFEGGDGRIPSGNAGNKPSIDLYWLFGRSKRGRRHENKNPITVAHA